ncbi:hypothetical protein ABT348_24175 [Streptomyces olivaceus]|uniref:hypothetical protein n=1 Tax=Streptomyces olivaceus TaxID=47716 RepID=UPI003328A33C
MNTTDPLESIPAETLARYVEGVADILQAEGEQNVEDLEVYAGHPYMRIWAELAQLHQVHLEIVQQIDRLGELMASNRRLGRGYTR